MLNAGQKLLKHNALTKYGLLPASVGGVIGGAKGTYETSQGYGHEPISKSAFNGAMIGLGVGGIAGASTRGVRDYRLFKTSRYTNAPNSYGLNLGSFGQTLSEL